MEKTDLYDQIAGIYVSCKAEREKLRREIEKAQAKIDTLENMMCDLDLILTKHGKHYCEHYEKREDSDVREQV